MVVQKTVVSPSKEVNPSTSSPIVNGNKKRRAPPPPPDKLPFVQSSCAPTCQEKENPCKSTRPRTGRPSLDAKFSAIIQQLQKSHAPYRKNPPLAQIEPPCNVYASKTLDTETDLIEQAEKVSTHLSLPPIPAPRNKLRKSFREKINHKAW